MNGLLLDIYTVNDENESFIKICIKTDKGKVFIEDKNFKPYFYLISDKELSKADLMSYNLIDIIETKKDLEQISLFGHFKAKPLSVSELKKTKIYKLIFSKISDLVEARGKIKSELFYAGKFEYDIPFDFRYIIDKNIFCSKYYEIEDKDGLEFKEIKNKNINLKSIAFDIETLGKSLNANKEQIILLSLYSKDYKKVLGYKEPKNKPDYFVLVKDEKELLQEFLSSIKQFDPDLIYTYNGDGFDFPFVKTRCKKLGLDKKFNEIFDPEYNNGRGFALRKYQHIDVYKVIRSLSRKGSLNLFKFDLDTVYNYLFGKHKVDVKYSEIEEIYNNPNTLSKFIEYNLVDSIACYEIGENFLEQFVALSKIVGKSLQKITRISSSNIVESIIMHFAISEGKIIPNIPVGATIDARLNKQFQGAFVKEPEIGLHENIAVVDFQSLYPSVIITYNISPETINRKTKNMFESPSGYFFSQDIKATIPKMLEQILNERIKIKNEMKKQDKNSLKYKILFAYQWSFKTVLNSTYGYMGYSRARWYNFNCAKSIAGTSREHTLKMLKEAENLGLEVIYGDTDSIFIKYKKDKKEIYDFLDLINSKLPGVMHLSLDGLYKRGLFVKKKGTKGSAKKKYALIDENDSLKIVGFEYVRHDWAEVAKKTQKKVLKFILKYKDIEKAKIYVQDTIKKIDEHKIENKDLVIFNLVRKNIEDYASIGPAVSAIKKAKRKGLKVNESFVGYIVTKNGKTISDRAEVAETVKEGNYDAEYYIYKQILPCVKNIFAIFNISEDQLMNKPEQKKLF